MRSRPVRIQIWRIDVGRVQLYLLDTDRADNHLIDRWITGRLYIGDRHTRLAQYGVLGVGGMRALAALGIEPCVVHLNEGHAALASFERLRVLLAAGQSYDDALAAVRNATVFTTHTPVAAGNESYAPDEVEPVLGQLREGLDVYRPFFYGLCRLNLKDEREAIAITPLALRTSRAAIGVSRRHGEVARAMWQPLWPGRAVHEVPIGHVTNGVHTTTWMAEPMQALLDRHLGSEWRHRLADRALWDQIASIPDAELWSVRRILRQDLVEYARAQSIRVRLARGESPDYVEAAARAFDSEGLTIGFAQRVATYKRLHLLTRRLDRGLRLFLDDPYFRTKHDAERVVRDGCSLPWRIYRPALVVGHSETGEMDKVDGPYYFFPLLERLAAEVPALLLVLRLCSQLLLDACLRRVVVASAYARASGCTLDGSLDLLLVHWVREENPTADFAPGRPPLLLQRHPGLGVLRPAFRVAMYIARDLGTDGVANRPKFFHDAVIFHRSRLFLFLDGREQGRFEALQRDLTALSLRDATLAVAGWCVRDEGDRVLHWDPGYQVFPVSPRLIGHFHAPAYAAAVTAAQETSRFRIDTDALLATRARLGEVPA